MAIRETQTAVAALGQNLQAVNGANEMDLDTAFTTLLQQQVGALVIDGDAFFYTRREQIIEQAARSAMPTVYPWREAVFAGGLMSYGTGPRSLFAGQSRNTTLGENHAKFADGADRLGERELALCRHTGGVRFFLYLDRHLAGP